MANKSDLILSVTRIIEASRSTVWRCWTEPELLKQWYCPKPWQVSDAQINLTPGGRMNVTMTGLEGECIAVEGSFLNIVPQHLLIFTDAYTEGFMPKAESFMTGMVELSDVDIGNTKMVWSARHATQEQVKQHLEMGFETGWNTSADQLNQLAKSLS